MPFSHTDTLIQQNEEASWAGFVLDGNMAVEVNGNKVATLGAGAIIGGKIFKRKRACIAYMESTVVDISIPPPSFILVSLSSPRSPLSKNT